MVKIKILIFFRSSSNFELSVWTSHPNHPINSRESEMNTKITPQIYLRHKTVSFAEKPILQIDADPMHLNMVVCHDAI